MEHLEIEILFLKCFHLSQSFSVFCDEHQIFFQYVIFLFQLTFQLLLILSSVFLFICYIFSYICFILFSSDVYNLLSQSKFDEFRKLLEIHPTILNNLRSDANNRTLLMEAFVRSHHHIAQYLLNNFPDDIDVMAVNEIGWTALHWAARKDNVDVIQNILKINHECLNVRTNYGVTPLHWAAYNNHKRNVEFLLNQGADVNIRDISYKTPDQVSRDPEIKEMIRKYRNK